MRIWNRIMPHPILGLLVEKPMNPGQTPPFEEIMHLTAPWGEKWPAIYRLTWADKACRTAYYRLFKIGPPLNA